MPAMENGLTYKNAGVDIDAQDQALARIKELARATFTPGVLSEIGSFGGLFTLQPENPEAPVLVASADGVGTKLKVAQMAGKHHTVGEDLVNHCVNDILVQGARPLFFLDYLATGKLQPHVVVELVSGMARACQVHGCALLGGETAEMPGFYGPGEYDLAGFIVGLAFRDRLLDRNRVAAGDSLVALPSSGLHTNGYSLARKVFFETLKLTVDSYVPELACTVGEELLRVHRSYFAAVWPLVEAGLVKSAAHITGGGIPDNLPRALPPHLGAEIDLKSFDEPAVFRLIRQAGKVPEEDMRRTFNLGVGMILVVGEQHVGQVLSRLVLHGPGWIIGRVVEGAGVRFVGERVG
ncbi:phosphoribosylaminoimidazole synthetase [Thermoanaerobaculum aquaticum]|uniref:Phosphoribosylformylglycinamidine cyclo-ligase n=2 Tax=Thermoanaerobaculum aquaticum TaxID=1312852 RepID=A0A062Y289_9BACT|nr:phosphoribosylaminoimidazole synthetase [Thermoanaerobaculum aquaticum]